MHTEGSCPSDGDSAHQDAPRRHSGAAARRQGTAALRVYQILSQRRQVQWLYFLQVSAMG